MMRSIITYSMVLLTALVSCSKADDAISSLAGEEQMVDLGSALSATSLYLDSNEEVAISVSLDYGVDDPYTKLNNRWSYSDEVWSSEEAIYWSSLNSPLSLYLYYPYLQSDNFPEISNSASTDQSAEDSYNSSNLICYHNDSFTPAVDLANELTMTPLLGQINLEFSFETYGVTLENSPSISSVVVNVAPSYTCDVSCGSVVDATAAGSSQITPYNPSKNSYSLIAPPQTISTTATFIEVDVDYGGDEHIQYTYSPTSDITIKSGRSTTLKLTIDEHVMSLDNDGVVVGDWQDSNDLGSDELTKMSVGDLVPSDSPVGVIYEVSVDGKSIKILSLECGTNITWTDATGEWLTSLNSGSYTWHIPTKEELAEIYSAHLASENLESAVAGYSDTALTPAIYWSSEEDSSDSSFAWVQLFSHNENPVIFADPKSDRNSVRAILEIDIDRLFE